MKKKLKLELQLLYEAPKSRGKEVFLREIGEPEISYATFLRRQVLYIGKWNWVLEMLLFMLAILVREQMAAESVWVLASFTPFLAVAAVAEGSRSIRHHMQEMELATRFSLKAVVMSRLVIMGGSNLILLFICILTVGKGEAAELLYSGGMILTPYLLSACLNLFAVRRVHGGECMYVCMGISVLVSGISIIMGAQQNFLSEQLSGTGVAAVLVLFSILAAREWRKFMKQAEEYVWN